MIPQSIYPAVGMAAVHQFAQDAHCIFDVAETPPADSG
jgi:hypothetical protein